jgi:23S rRNA (pseudouridine1915-N3)-methyltransferase
MNINIIAVGKIKEAYIRDGIKEFEKRLSSHCKVNIVELADEKTKEDASQKEIDLVLKKEGERIDSQLKGHYTIALDIKGKKLDSIKFADKIENLMIDGISDVNFIIGGSLGISDDILKKADFRLSFSDMTFPHQLMRLILLEQIYRAFRIINNFPYHK